MNEDRQDEPMREFRRQYQECARNALMDGQQMGDGVDALHRIYYACLRHQGAGTKPLLEFLLSLHNAEMARPDIYMLCRRVDDAAFEDIINVMRWFRSGVHAFRLPDGTITGNADMYHSLPDGRHSVEQLFAAWGIDGVKRLEASRAWHRVVTDASE